MSFIISNLSAKIGQTEILKDVSLTIEKGKIHVLMGKNGSGKSTLAQAIMGNPALSVEGKIELDNIDLSLLKTHERAQKGLFMSFQNPVSIPGVSLNTLLRTAYNSIKNKKLDVVEFHKLLKEKLKILNLDSSFSTRAVNEKMSGGEKKKAEILQLAVLEPKYAIIDECDSGLDIDAIKTIGKAIKSLCQNSHTGILLITHYERILKYLSPDIVSVMSNGKIIKTGGKELAEEIEKRGFENLAYKNEL